MTYKTRPGGVLTDGAIIEEYFRAEHITANSDQVRGLMDGLRGVAQAQHRATRKATLDEVREKVRGLGLRSPSGSIGPLFDVGWGECLKAVLKALGEKGELE